MLLICSNKNCIYLGLCSALQEIHIVCMLPVSDQCSLMFSSGLGKKVQINKVCGRLLAERSEYSPFPTQKAQEESLGNYQDGIQDRQRNVGSNIILVFFLKVLMNSNYRILNSFTDQ